MAVTRRGLLLGAGAAAVLSSRGARAQADGDAPLRLLSWPETHDPATLAAFTAASGRAVDVVPVGEEREAVARLREGPARYDLALLGDGALALALGEGLLQPLDLARLPAVEPGAMPRRFLQRAELDGRLHALPWTWGWLGALWNATLAVGPLATWADFWRLAETSFQGLVLLPDDPVVTPGVALKALGHEWASSDPAALDAAAVLLQGARRGLFAVSSDLNLPLLTDDAGLAPAWSHDARALCRADPRYQAVLPQDGGLLWLDSLAVPAWAPDPAASHALLDWLAAPSAAAAEASFNGLALADSRAQALLPATLAGDPLLYPPAPLVAAADFVAPSLARDPARLAMVAHLKGA